MKNSKVFIIICLLFCCFVTSVEGYTEVASISASPEMFNNFNGETTSITVNATPGVTGLEIRILTNDTSTVVRSGLSLTETASGVYTTTWDGTDNNDAMVWAGSYTVRVFNAGTTTFIGPSSTIKVEGLGHDAPSPFVPTGTNAVTFIYKGVTGQTGLKLAFYHQSRGYWWYDSSWNRFLPLTETSTPGLYTASWSPTYGNNSLLPDGILSITVYDAAGNQSATTGQIRLAGVSSVSASPSQFPAYPVHCQFGWGVLSCVHGSPWLPD